MLFAPAAAPASVHFASANCACDAGASSSSLNASGPERPFRSSRRDSPPNFGAPSAALPPFAYAAATFASVSSGASGARPRSARCSLAGTKKAFAAAGSAARRRRAVRVGGLCRIASASAIG